jgi:hypothetical protein
VSTTTATTTLSPSASAGLPSSSSPSRWITRARIRLSYRCCTRRTRTPRQARRSSSSTLALPRPSKVNSPASSRSLGGTTPRVPTTPAKESTLEDLRVRRRRHDAQPRYFPQRPMDRAPDPVALPLRRAPAVPFGLARSCERLCRGDPDETCDFHDQPNRLADIVERIWASAFSAACIVIVLLAGGVAHAESRILYTRQTNPLPPGLSPAPIAGTRDRRGRIPCAAASSHQGAKWSGRRSSTPVRSSRRRSSPSRAWSPTIRSRTRVGSARASRTRSARGNRSSAPATRSVTPVEDSATWPRDRGAPGDSAGSPPRSRA